MLVDTSRYFFRHSMILRNVQANLEASVEVYITPMITEDRETCPLFPTDGQRSYEIVIILRRFTETGRARVSLQKYAYIRSGIRKIW